MAEKEIGKRSFEEILKEMKIKVLASNLRRQLKYIIEWGTEWGDVEIMEDALRYLSNINMVKAEEEAKKAAEEAMKKEA